MIESFEYNNHYKSQQPCASYNIFVAALEVGHFYAVLEWCWESDDDTSFHVRTYVDRSKADEIIVEHERRRRRVICRKSSLLASPMSWPKGRLFSFLRLHGKRNGW